MTRLAIVGASVRAAVQSALRAGFEVVGADLFADADLDGVCPITRINSYPEGLADWLAEQRVDAWMYTGALENYPDLVDRMAKLVPLWGVSGEALRRCRDPLVLQEVCNRAGLTFPETRRLAEVDPHEDGWLGKTYRHSGGIGVWHLPSGLRHESDAYAQRFVDGRSIAALYVVSNSRSKLLGVTEQLSGDDPQQMGYVGSIGPFACDASTLERLGTCLRETLGLSGLVGVDLIVGEDRLYVIEINPRFTASVEVLERAFGRSAVGALCDAYRSQPFEPWIPTAGRCIAKRVLFAERDVTISPAFVELDVVDTPRPGEVIEKGRPVCTLIVEASNEVTVRKRLHEAVAAAERLLYADCEPE